jgi:hypothetical protein
MYASDATEQLALHEGRYWHGLRVSPSFNGQAEDKIAKARREDVSDTTVLMTSDNGF